MRVLVIGGTGRVGPYLLRDLIRRGHDVTIVHRGQRSRPKDLDAREILADRRDYFSFAARMRRENPDVVIDLFPGRAEDTRAVVEAFRGRIRASVHISAFDVYEQYVAVDLFDAWDVSPELAAELASRPLPIREGAPLRTAHLHPHPGIVAGFDKVLVEHEIRRAEAAGDFPATILRAAAIYGPAVQSHDDPRLREWYYVKRILDGRSMLALPDSGGAMLHRVHYANVARAATQAAESPRAAGRAYNVGDLQVFTVRQLADRVARTLGHRWELVSVPRSWIKHWHPFDADPPFLLDVSRLQIELGYEEAVDAAVGLEETVEHLAQTRPGTKHLMFDYEAEDRVIAQARALLGAAEG